MRALHRICAVTLVTISALGGMNPSPRARTRAAGTLPDLPGMVRLTNQTPPQVTSGQAQRLGPLAATAQLTLNIALGIRHRAALNTFISTQARYGHYLSQAAFDALFGATTEQVRAVEQWALLHRLRLLAVSGAGLLISVEGSVAGVESAFHVLLATYKRQSGGTFYSNDRDATVPASLGIMAITGLDDLRQFHLMLRHPDHSPAPRTPAVRSGGYWPSDFRAAYDLAGHGYDGSLQTIGFTGWGQPIADSDLHTFATHVGDTPLSAGTGADQIEWVNENGGSAQTDTDSQNEVAMDVEYAHGMATHAHLKYFLSDDSCADGGCGGTATGLELAVQAAASDPTIHVVSNSWGTGSEPATSYSDPFTVSTDQSFAQAASVGTTFFFSSGDEGSVSGGDTSSTGLPSYPADDPNVVTVGGTTLATHADQTWAGETGWSIGSIPSDPLASSGGGCSAAFVRPAYQQAVDIGDTGLCLYGRAEPDVAADGDPNTGAAVYFTDPAHPAAGTIAVQTGGTSLSAPLWAGMAAVTNRYAALNQLPALGWANPRIYQLAANVGEYAKDFHDVLVGANDQFVARPGWDAVTGWGSIDWWAWTRAIIGMPGPTPTPSATMTPTPNVPTATPTATVAEPWLADAAIAYQVDAAHSGNAAADTLAPPLRQRWAVNLGGTVSYPLVVRDRVFVTVTRPQVEGSRLFALDRDTGAVVWGPVEMGGPWQWSGIAYDNGRIFAVNPRGAVRTFDAESGDPGWATSLTGTQYIFDSPPTAYNGILYVSGAGYGSMLYALDEGTGKLLWSQQVLGGEDTSPAVSATGVYVSYVCAQTYDFAPTTGQQLWHFSDGCEGGGGSEPALHDGKLYVRDTFGSSPTVLDAATGQELGIFSADPIPAFAGKIGFFLSGSTLQAVDQQSGWTLWSFTGDGTLVSAPLVVNGYVYVGSSTGRLYALNATTGAVADTTTLPAAIATPDQFGSVPYTGLNAGSGELIVPAMGWLVAFDSSAPQATSTPTATATATPPTTPVITANVGAWPLFRQGPAHHAQADAVGPLTGAAPTWRFQAGGALHASPAVGPDGTLYIGSADANLYAVLPTGTAKWQISLDGQANASPALGTLTDAAGAHTVVYQGTAAGSLYAVEDAGTPRQLWRARFGGAVNTVTLGNGLLYVGTGDGRVYALDPATGFVHASYIIGAPITSTPAIAADGTVLVGAGDQQFYAFSPHQLLLQWSFSTTGIMASSPTVDSHSIVYTGDDNGTIFALQALSTATFWQGLVWRYQTGGPVTSSPALGRDGIVYCGSEDGKVYALNADGTLKWATPTGASIDGSVVLGGDETVYVGNDGGTLLALDPATGHVKWTYTNPTRSPFSGSPALNAGGILYVAADDGALYAFTPAGGPRPTVTQTPTATPIPTQALSISLDAGWNLISLPLAPTQPVQASALLRNVLAATGGSTAALYMLINGAWSQGAIISQAAVPVPDSTDFTLQLGHAYLLYTDRAGDLTLTGLVPASAPPWNLAVGWNLVSVPAGSATPIMASNVLTKTITVVGSNVAALYGLTGEHWSPALLANRTEAGGSSMVGTDFPLGAGAGYLLYSSGGGTITPDTITPTAPAPSSSGRHLSPATPHVPALPPLPADIHP